MQVQKGKKIASRHFADGAVVCRGDDSVEEQFEDLELHGVALMCDIGAPTRDKFKRPKGRGARRQLKERTANRAWT